MELSEKQYWYLSDLINHFSFHEMSEKYNKFHAYFDAVKFLAGETTYIGQYLDHDTQAIYTKLCKELHQELDNQRPVVTLDNRTQ